MKALTLAWIVYHSLAKLSSVLQKAFYKKFSGHKPEPADFDVCWGRTGLSLERLDTIFLTLDRGRAAQTARFGGDTNGSSVVYGSPYAASCLMIYLGRYERVNVNSWARTLVGQELGRTVTDKEAHSFFEEYGKWKALVYHFYPWRGS